MGCFFFVNFISSLIMYMQVPNKCEVEGLKSNHNTDMYQLGTYVYWYSLCFCLPYCPSRPIVVFG